MLSDTSDTYIGCQLVLIPIVSASHLSFKNTIHLVSTIVATATTVHIPHLNIDEPTLRDQKGAMHIPHPRTFN